MIKPIQMGTHYHPRVVSHYQIYKMSYCHSIPEYPSIMPLIFHNNLYPIIVSHDNGTLYLDMSFRPTTYRMKIHKTNPLDPAPSRPRSIFGQKIHICIIFCWLFVHSLNNKNSQPSLPSHPWHERTIISRRPKRWLKPPLAALPRRIPR